MKVQPRNRSRWGLAIVAVAGLSTLGCLVALAATVLPSKSSDSQTIAVNPIEKARRCLDEGRLAAAKAAFLDVLKGDPKNVKALVGLGMIARESGDDEEAIRYFERVTALDPKNVAAFRALSNLYSAAGRQMEAMSAIQSAMALAPEDNAEMSRLMTKILTSRSTRDDPMAGFPGRPMPGGPMAPMIPQPPDPKKFLPRTNPH